MKVVQLKCPSCGSSIEIEEDKKKTRCSYCHNQVMIDEEIIKVEHKIIDNEFEKKLKKANTFLKEFEEYGKAQNAFEELIDEYPYESEGWYGLILSITQNYERKHLLSEELNKVKKYIEKYKKIEKNEKLLKKRLSEFDLFLKKEQKQDSFKSERTTEISLEKSKINYKIIAIVFIAFVVVGILLFSFNNESGDNTIVLKTAGESFYENFYYKQIKSDQASYLKNFEYIGIKISLENLERVETSLTSINSLSSCNKQKTKVIIYPKAPFGRKDYIIEVELDC